MNKHITMILLSSLMFACGGGNSPYSAPATSTNNGSSTTTPNPADPNTGSAAWNNFTYTAAPVGGTSANSPIVSISTANKTITITLPLLIDSSLLGVLSNIPIPKIDGATISLGQMADGRPAVTVTIPLTYVAKGITTLPSSTLPNGAALPGMPSGSEPYSQVQLGTGKIPVYIYIGPMSVGVFVNTPFDPMVNSHVSLKDSDGTIAGEIDILKYTSSTQKDGGFYINVNVPSKYTQLILNNL